MIEHLVILVIEAMARKERAEQQVSLDAVVADLDRLHSDPAAALTDQDVVIPPARHGPLSLLVGVAMGIIMCAALLATFAVVRPHLPLPKPVPRQVRQVVVLGTLPVMAGLIALGYVLARRWLRGGQPKSRHGPFDEKTSVA